MASCNASKKAQQVWSTTMQTKETRQSHSKCCHDECNDTCSIGP